MRVDGFSIPEALYIHVPFCVSRCTYCDFYSNVASRAGVDSMEGVITRTLDRAEALALRFGADHFDTVYVGGGTPSCLPRPLLRRLLSGLGRIAGAPREWTVEANPESVDPPFLDILEESGVNRLSMGIQTLDPSLAQTLGRPGRPADSLSALRQAMMRKLRVSADLIAGTGREGGLIQEARILIGEGVEHLSVYDLILEEGTLLEDLHRRGDFALMDEDEDADEREGLNEALAGLGLLRYEVSNYARPGTESLHNCCYWRMGSWLGAGPGAVSCVEVLPPGPSSARPGIDGASLRIEEARCLEGRQEAIETVVDPLDAAFESIMMASRTVVGLDRNAFASRFGYDVEELVGKTLATWLPKLRIEGRRIALAEGALDLGSAFLRDCLGEIEGRKQGSVGRTQTKKS